MRLRMLAYVAIGIVLIIVVLFVVKVINENGSVTFTEVTAPGVPQITKNDALYGNPSATVQVVHFGYAGCDHCEEMQTDIRALIDDGLDVLLVWKDYPNSSLVPESLSSAIAMRCSQEQDAFWEYQPLLFAAPNPAQSTFIAIAESLELKPRKFERCLKNGTGAEIVQKSIEEGNVLGITATPTIFIDGVRFTGLYSSRELADMLTP